MLDKKDLDAIEKILDKKFLEVEDRLDKKWDKKIDAKFEEFEIKMNNRMDAKFGEFETKMITRMDAKFEEFETKMITRMDAKLNSRFAKFTEEVAEVLKDITYTIDKRFSEIEAKLDMKIEEQNKILDSLVNSYKENLDEHAKYNDNFSKINSKLFDYDLRLVSLEKKITNKAI